MVGDRGVERRQNRIQFSRHFTFIAARNHQPERLALLVQIFLDGIERRVGLAVARSQGVGGGIHFWQTGKQNRGAEQNYKRRDR